MVTRGHLIGAERERLIAITVLATALLGTACQFEQITVADGRERPVVHAVLNPWAPDVAILVERTLTGRVTVDDDVPPNRNDPIVTGGGIPIRHARVIVYDERGDSVVAVEDATSNSDGRGAGVYRFRNRASSRDPAIPGLPSLPILPGATYRLRITTVEGDTVTGTTTVPEVSTVAPGTGTRFFNRDRDTLRFFWDAVPLSHRYLVRIESPWGPMFLFTEQFETRLPGTLRNVFQNNFPSVFLPGFQSRISVAAVDRNYFDYYRSASDPFTGTGLISRLDGGVGVFAGVAELYSYNVFVTANLDDPFEGWYENVAPQSDGIAPFTMKLFIESEGGSTTFITGEHYGSPDVAGGPLMGLRSGNRLSVAFLESDISDTLSVFVGDIRGDSLIGVVTAGPLSETLTYRKTTRRD